jgi:diguanylate cyclase (GGDEF)-like protein
MEKAAPPERTAARREEHGLSPAWEQAQAALSAESGLALLLVDGPQPPQLSVSNNNSICHALQSSPAHRHLCDPYCGEAYRRTRSAGERTDYRCHAGLHCFTTTIGAGKNSDFSVIGGRAFLSASDYRDLVERFRTGDLRELLSPDLFSNVLFGSREEIDRLAARVAETFIEVSSALSNVEAPSAAARENVPAGAAVTDPFAGGEATDGARADEFFPPGTTLEDAGRRMLEELTAAHRLVSAALLIRKNGGFATLCATGRFKTIAPQLGLKEQGKKRGGAVGKSADGAALQSIVQKNGGDDIFPLVAAGEIKGALVVADTALDDSARESLNEYCRRAALPLELLRLRAELERRMRVAYHLQALTEQINSADPEEAYQTILRHSTELLASERASLLLFDEAAGQLEVKAAVGPRAKAAREARLYEGEGVSGKVLREGRPLVVRDLTAAGQAPAPAERRYKSESFISYPLTVGGRKVGVLNVTDKAAGGAYDDLDLNLLDMLAPQMALALDRAAWHQKATQFQLLSITDALTGLLNRRYLEERLGEEIERSKRHRFSMSFLMIDIDNFKEYNDRFGHQAGDRALELTAQCLKSALRSADVAARYGGEEFCVLLPQTSAPEALVIADRIRRRVETTPFPHGDALPGGAVTVSVGVSSFGPRLDTPESVVHGADLALYAAKTRGKNRVESYAPAADAANLPPKPDAH